MAVPGLELALLLALLFDLLLDLLLDLGGPGLEGADAPGARRAAGRGKGRKEPAENGFAQAGAAEQGPVEQAGRGSGERCRNGGGGFGRLGCKGEGLGRRGLGRGRERAVLPGGQQCLDLGDGGLDLGDEEGLHPVQAEGARRRTRHGGAQAGETRLGDGGMICHEVNIIHSPFQRKSA